MKERLIAVVDDEPGMIDLLTGYLGNKGFIIRGFGRDTELFEFLEKETPDLLLLDLGLPGLHGFEICKKLRTDDKYADLPIIILSANDEEFDKVKGLDIGADDYVVKPCSLEELKSRINAVLRRKTPEDERPYVDVGEKIHMDSGKHEVRILNKKIDLTSAEFKILWCLASKKGQ